MKRPVLLLVVWLTLAACVPQTGSEEFGAPEIVEVGAVVNGAREARLSCTLSEPRAERCGFAYGAAGAPLSTVECELAGTTFELRLEGLKPGASYEWYAFAEAGESEVRSQTARFTLEPLPQEEVVEVPDQVFKAYLTEHFDGDGDGEISVSEALDVRKIAVKTDRIFSLEGIEYFKSLDTLICRGVNPEVGEYDYDGSPGRLRSLDLNANIWLRHLECDGNALQMLVLPDNPSLEFLRCSHNKLTTLDLSRLTGLVVLKAYNNSLVALDVSNNPHLQTIEVHSNQIKSIDVSACPLVGTLNLGDNYLEEVDVSNCTKVHWLGVFGNNIASLDLRNNSALRWLNCYDSSISALDLSACPVLYELRCWNCRLEELDVSMLSNLELLEAAPMNSLKKIYVSDTQSIEGVTQNRCESNVPAGTTIVVRHNGEPEELVQITDPVFKKYLTEHFDTDSDDEISVSEALMVRKIAVKTDRIFSLEGIEYFKNLDTLICRGVDPDANEYNYDGSPGRLRSLDLSALSFLMHLECDGNYLETLILPESPWLVFLRCSHNRLKELDLSRIPNLRLIRAFNNDLSELDFRMTPNIESIEIGANQIGSIDVTQCPKLGVLNLGNLRSVKELDLSGNPRLGWLGIYDTGITSIDLSHNPQLNYLNCQVTSISSLDLSKCTKLYELKCWDCLIEELDVSMLPALEVLDCSPMPTLKTLYVADSQVIDGVTMNRSEDNVPAGTNIIIRYPGLPDGKIIFEDPCFKAYLVSVFDHDRDGEISLEEASEIYKIHICSDEWNITSLQGIEFMPNLEFLCCSGTWISTVVLNRPHYYLSKHYHWDDLVGPIGTLKKVDVTHNHKLRLLDVSNNSGIGETGNGTVDVSNCPELEELYLQMCYIKYPDVSACKKLRTLNLSHGRGDIPVFSNNPELLSLDLGHEQRGRQQPIDVSHCPLLEELVISASASALSDLSYNPKLKVLNLSWCMQITPDLSNLPLLEVFETQGNELTSLNLSKQRNLVSLNVSGNPLGSLDLSNQKGLKRLMCNSCGLSSLDLSALGKLEYLECDWNSLSSLDLSDNPFLEEIYLTGNPLGSIDVSSLPRLYKLYCAYTGISTLDVSHNPVLWDLRCDHNGLKQLDISVNPKLWGVYCESNSLKEINLSTNGELQELDCSSNRIESLDISRNPLLRWMNCCNNLIQSLDVSGNAHFSGSNGDDITGLFCAPMNDAFGNNVLESLWVKEGQMIKGVTVERSAANIPAKTVIKIK